MVKDEQTSEVLMRSVAVMFVIYLVMILAGLGYAITLGIQGH